MSYFKTYYKEKYRTNKEEVNARFEELKIKNKDKCNSIFECECGSKLLYSNKGHLFKTQKHQEHVKREK